MPESFKDASHLYEVERRATHAAREGFRINELTISTKQKVPWHHHTRISDTFYVQDPKESRALAPGASFTVEPKRPHLVVNSGQGPATFLILQGLGEYDFVPLT